MVWRCYGLALLRPLVTGAIAYTVGAVVDGVGWPTLVPRVIGPHELFHAAVLCGVAAHWRFVRQFAGGVECVESEAARGDSLSLADERST